MNVESYQFLDQRETQPIKNPLRSRPINKWFSPLQPWRPRALEGYGI